MQPCQAWQQCRGHWAGGDRHGQVEEVHRHLERHDATGDAAGDDEDAEEAGGAETGVAE